MFEGDRLSLATTNELAMVRIGAEPKEHRRAGSNKCSRRCYVSRVLAGKFCSFGFSLTSPHSTMQMATCGSFSLKVFVRNEYTVASGSDLASSDLRAPRPNTASCGTVLYSTVHMYTVTLMVWYSVVLYKPNQVRDKSEPLHK